MSGLYWNKYCTSVAKYNKKYSVQSKATLTLQPSGSYITSIYIYFLSPSDLRILSASPPPPPRLRLHRNFQIPRDCCSSTSWNRHSWSRRLLATRPAPQRTGGRRRQAGWRRLEAARWWSGVYRRSLNSHPAWGEYWLIGDKLLRKRKQCGWKTISQRLSWTRNQERGICVAWQWMYLVWACRLYRHYTLIPHLVTITAPSSDTPAYKPLEWL